MLVISNTTEPTNKSHKRACLLNRVGESVNDISDTIPDNGTDAECDKAADKVNREYEVFQFH